MNAQESTNENDIALPVQDPSNLLRPANTSDMGVQVDTQNAYLARRKERLEYLTSENACLANEKARLQQIIADSLKGFVPKIELITIQLKLKESEVQREKLEQETASLRTRLKELESRYAELEEYIVELELAVWRG
jgi:hypothetical protein